ncbi:NAD(P)-binding protein [Hymenopellis radicata]|nr:NAD(P)-binding protein [Hymenopellis radicata]
MSTIYKRVILVTGSNTGIGFEIVRCLGEKGHTVYLSARNLQAGLDAQSQLKDAGVDVKFVHLDVTSSSSVSAAKEVIEKAEGHLDSLVLNHGISMMQNNMGGPLHVSLSSIQATLDTNLFGLITVCQTFAPLLRSAPSATRASNTVMATSPKFILHRAISYNTSKVAANSYMIALAKELEGEVKVNIVTPGFVTTKLNGFAPGGKTPRQGAEIIVPWALLGPEDNDKHCLFWGPDGRFDW